MPKSWFSVQAKDNADTADIAIFDEIGYWGVTAKDFINALNQHKGKKVSLHINSPGGSVFDALAIYNALRGHGSEITVKVMGIAASAASLIAMAGDKIIMPENTFMMVHNPWGVAIGNAEEVRDFAEILDKIGASLVKTYVARTGMEEKDVKDFLADETWMSAAEAVEFGFADEMEPALKLAASFDIERLPENIKAALAPKTEEVEVEAEIVLDETFAKQASALIAAAGLSEFSGVFLVAADLKTIDDMKAAVLQAREVRALCDAAKLPDMACALIRSRASMEEARAKLCGALADADEATHTDSTITDSTSKPAKTAHPAALKTADVWAARRLTVH